MFAIASNMSERSAVIKSSVQFFCGTILSRVTGFFREVALGAWFGASPVLAAFFVAYRFSQLLRRVFGESSLLSSFSPHYEQLKLQCPEKAGSFFRDLCASMSATLGSIIIILEAALFVWWKWVPASEGTREILFLTMVMLPGVLFVCLYALFSALLQTDRKYFLPSVAPIFFNLIFLFVLWSVKEWEPQSAVVALAFGVTFAFFIQWLSLVCSTGSFLKHLRWSQISLWTPELKNMASAMSLTIIGIGAVQINGFVDTLFARSADLSGPAYLYYAMRLYQLPLALFGIALSSALLPPLARARLAEDKTQFLELLQFALRRSVSLMVPLSAALLVFGGSIVNVVYGRGAFDPATTLETTNCLAGYALGLVPAVLVLLLAPAFYACKDFKTPLKASLLSVILNLVLNALFIYVLHWGTASVAVATSIAAFLNAGYLFYALKQQEGTLLSRATLISFGKVIFCATLSGFFTWMISSFLSLTPSHDLLSQILNFSLHGGMFTLFFFSYAWMFKADDVLSLLKLK